MLLILKLCAVGLPARIYFLRAHKLSSQKTAVITEQEVFAYILGLATGVPQYKVSQAEALAIAQTIPQCETIRPKLERIYNNCQISTRYMAVPDMTPLERRGDEPCFYPDDKRFKVYNNAFPSLYQV